MFWNFFRDDSFCDENGVYDTYTDVCGVTHYSDGSSSYEDVLGNTHYSDGSAAYGTFRGDREHYDANGEYQKSSYKDAWGITRYY